MDILRTNAATGEFGLFLTSYAVLLSILDDVSYGTSGIILHQTVEECPPGGSFVFTPPAPTDLIPNLLWTTPLDNSVSHDLGCKKKKKRSFSSDY